MDNVHRSILRKNRTTIIENIANPHDVVELLFEKGTFTESMKQDVEAERTNHDKVRKIIDTLPKRGPRAFDSFYETMLNTSNTTVADILKPDLAGQHSHIGDGERGIAVPQEPIELPEDWPNESAMTANIDVKPCEMRAPPVTDQWLNPNVYSMKQLCRGRCVVISNKVFTGPLEPDKENILRVILPARLGTDKDVEDLKVLFTQLHFQMVVHHDKSAREIRAILLQEATNEAHKKAECFVFIICTHGTKAGVYGTDGNTVSLEEITTYFDGEHCKALREKPKLFFIQACQGEGMDRPSPADTVDAAALNNILHRVEALQVTNEPDAQRDNVARLNPAAEKRTIPTKVDMLMASATHPGYVSLRNTVYGSWFIQAVIYVFQKHAWKESITDLLTLVNNLVARGRSGPEGAAGNIMQAAVYQNSFTKKFFFFPGVMEATT